MGRRPPGIPLLGKAALTLGLVLLYYCFSIGITFYNKWLMKSFHFPLFMTLLHLLVIFLLSALTRALMHCCTKRSRVVLTWDDYLRRVAPTALSTALDIGLSNWSFLYITVSLYTMTKSSAILFILLFSLIFKLEELRMALVLVVLLIAGGLFMFTYESTQFNMEGFALVLGASFLGGIRWTLTQMLMQKAELGLQNPIDTMFHLQPLMFLGLFPLFAVFEGELAGDRRDSFWGLLGITSSSIHLSKVSVFHTSQLGLLSWLPVHVRFHIKNQNLLGTVQRFLCMVWAFNLWPPVTNHHSSMVLSSGGSFQTLWGICISHPLVVPASSGNPSTVSQEHTNTVTPHLTL
uniref:Solute carrier family 35 member C2 n=1 Tax=Terrapene triunguis TaxID=2587831 RepID=A0A674JE18_9SAUR